MKSTENLFFWKNWGKSYRFFYSFLFLLFIGLLIYAGVTYIYGIQNILDWAPESKIESIPSTLDVFSRSIFQIQVKVDTFLIEQHFSVGSIHISISNATIFIAIVFLAASILTAIITYLKRVYYLIGMTIIILFLALLKLDVTRVFGIYTNYFFIAITLVVLSASFYFQSIKKETSFFIRWIVFFILFAVVFFILSFFSIEKYPFLYLANYGLIIPGIITLIFIVTVAHEIIYAFIYITTRSAYEGSKNTILHFSVASLFYLGTLFLTFLKNTNRIHLNIYYIDAFLLLGVSIILGIIGFKRKCESNKSWIGFYPLGALFYISIAIISIATLAFIFRTANDPLIEAIEDIIIYSHIGVGIFCVLYAFSNFRKLVASGNQIYRVFYESTRFSFSMVRLGGVLIMCAFLFRAGYFPFYQSVAGYYNGIGDIYLAEENNSLAHSYYELASQYEFQNHKSNYSIAEVYTQLNREDIAIFYLKSSLLKKPSIASYLKLSELQLKNDLFFESLFTLKEGLKKFPHSGELYNNLALIYNKTNVLDSAYIYFEQAKKYISKKEIIESNLLYFWAKHKDKLEFKLDSILHHSDEYNYMAYRANQAAFYTLIHKKQNESNFIFPIDKVGLTSQALVYLHNTCLNNVYNNEDKVSSNQSIESKKILSILADLEKIPANNRYLQEIHFLQAIENYYHGNTKKGIELLQLVDTEESYSLYDEIMGLWLLEQKAPEIASSYFQKSMERGRKSGLLYKAIAMTEANAFPEAIELWRQIKKESPNFSLADEILLALTNSNASENDNIKLAKIAYLPISFSEKEKIANSISNSSYYMLAYRWIATEQLDKNELENAKKTIDKIQEVAVASPLPEEQINYLQARYLFLKRDWKELFLELLEKTNWESKQVVEHWKGSYYAMNKKEIEADSLFMMAIRKAPLNTEVIEAARIFYNNENKKEKIYNLIVESVHINPYNVQLYESYILQCLEMGLENYAEEGMENLKAISHSKEFEIFKIEYQKERERLLKSVDW